MHTTRLNVNEGDSCVSLYAYDQYMSTRRRICNFCYDPIMHVMENIINAKKNIQYLPNYIMSDNMIATHYHLFFDSKPGIWQFIVAYHTVMIQQVPFVAINNLYFC